MFTSFNFSYIKTESSECFKSEEYKILYLPNGLNKILERSYFGFFVLNAKGKNCAFNYSAAPTTLPLSPDKIQTSV